MSLLNAIERKLSKFIPSNLTYYLIIGQIATYVLVYTNPDYFNLLTLQGQFIREGQLWRLITFLFTPVSDNIIFVAFVWYIFYLYGTVLENKWGSVRFFIYLLLGYIATVSLAFIFPDKTFTNGAIYTSLFLAFAYLYPDYRLYIFFILPVKVKWLAVIAWIGILFAFLFGSLTIKIQSIISITNFLIFFGGDLLHFIGIQKHNLYNPSFVSKISTKPIHVCAICGMNEMKNPKMEIFYCQKCHPSTCYCGQHINKHTHQKI